MLGDKACSSPTRFVTLSRALLGASLPQEPMHPAKTCIELTSQNDNSLTRHSERLVFPVRPKARNVSLQPLRRHPFHRCSSIAFCSTSSTTGPTSSSASRPTCEVSSLRISNSFTTKKHKKNITSRLFSQSPTRHRLPRSSTGTFQLFSAARPQSSNHGHSMHRARPPAPRSLLGRPPVTFFLLASPPRGFFAQSPRRQLNSAKPNTTALMFRIKVTWL